MKYERSGSKGTQVIERKTKYDRRTDGQTDKAKTICLPQRGGHCDLDLWPTDPNINRGLLLNKGYHPMKYEGSGS